MYKLEYDWNKGDRLVSVEEQEGVVAVWCRRDWAIFIKLGEEQINMKKYNNDNKNSECKVTIYHKSSTSSTP